MVWPQASECRGVRLCANSRHQRREHRAMLKLYDYLPSQNGFKIRLLLQHLGQPYQHVPVAIFQGESRTPEFLEKNPVGAIPVLEPEPGVHIAESNAILCYLAEGTEYLPAERLARARVMQWLFFEQYYVEPTIGTLRFWVLTNNCLLYTSDAADERSSVDLGGRRI